MDSMTSKLEGYEFWVEGFDLHNGQYEGQVNFVKVPHIPDFLDPPHSMRPPMKYDRLSDAMDAARIFAEVMISTNTLATIILPRPPQTGYEVRSVNDVTTGDFLSFEMFVGNRWREIRVSGTALAVLSGDGGGSRLEQFERGLDKIIREAVPMALSMPHAPFILIAS